MLYIWFLMYLVKVQSYVKSAVEVRKSPIDNTINNSRGRSKFYYSVVINLINRYLE